MASRPRNASRHSLWKDDIARMINTAFSWPRVEEVIARAIAVGTVGVSIVTKDGAAWHHHGDRKFSAASTVKIPIMVEVFRRVDMGERRLDETLRLTEAAKVP